MSITPKSAKILWANSAGRCAFPGCQCRLCTDEAAKAAPYTIGEMAHICGEKPGASRHDGTLTEKQRDDYANLILLCPNHHTLIDKPENLKKYSVETLHKMKSDHEGYVNGRLEVRSFQNKQEVAAYVYPLLKENHDVFLLFGPRSEIARRNPQSDAHGVWMSERLSTITPNNRKIVEIIEANSQLFAAAEQVVLKKFSLHARSYEGWVTDDVSYEGVAPFPEEFDAMITGLADVRT
jgi:hypothetical protein